MCPFFVFICVLLTAKGGEEMIRKILVQLTAGALTVLLATSFCFAGENTEAYDPAEVSSAGESEIMPMTIGISSMRASLSFNGADAICALNMFADTNKVTKAIMSVKLQRKSGSTYVTVKNWRDESASADATGYIKFQRRFTVFDRGTYRVKVDGKVYKGSSVVDTFSVVSAERVY